MKNPTNSRHVRRVVAKKIDWEPTIITMEVNGQVITQSFPVSDRLTYDTFNGTQIKKVDKKSLSELDRDFRMRKSAGKP